jgi:hypothetical protein
VKKIRGLSTRIEDDELLNLLEQRAAKTAAADEKWLKQEADLHRAVQASLVREEATKT